MKRILLAMMLAFCASIVQAANMEGYNMLKSTFTTSQVSAYITGSRAGDVLMRVIVSSPTVDVSYKVYDSTWTTTDQIGSVLLGTVQEVTFERLLTKGLYIVTNAACNGVTTTWKDRSRP